MGLFLGFVKSQRVVFTNDLRVIIGEIWGEFMLLLWKFDVCQTTKYSNVRRLQLKVAKRIYLNQITEQEEVVIGGCRRMDT